MSWTPTLSACSPRPMLIVPMLSSVSSHRLRQTWQARATANMPTSQAVQVAKIMHTRNTLSISPESDWATRYWRNYTQLLDIKAVWDPSNQFHHCQSVGSTDTACCPHYDQAGAGQGKQCMGVSGPGAGKPCVFPFSYLGTRYLIIRVFQ